MWNHIPESIDLGILRVFDVLIRGRSAANPLPDFADWPNIIIASDFTGEQRESVFKTFSLVMMRGSDWRAWHHRVAEIRKQYNLGNRRISYAKLRDTRKSAALRPLLAAANRISGVSATILVDKQVRTLFIDGKVAPGAVGTAGEHFVAIKPAVFERTMRAVSIVALFVAGLSAPGQDIYWATDEDEIAPNESRVKCVGQSFSSLARTYASHPLGDIHFGTTATADDGDLDVEDLAAIADLIGGAATEALSAYERMGLLHLRHLVVPPPSNMAHKAFRLMDSLFGPFTPLRKLMFSVFPVEGDDGLLIKEVQVASEPRIVRL